MYDLKSLLEKYKKNFFLLEKIKDIPRLEYLDLKKIIIITDINLVEIKSFKEVLYYFNSKYETTLITLPSNEPNYKMIEETSKKIYSTKYDLLIGLGGGSVLDVTKAAAMYENSREDVDNFAGSKKNYKSKTIKK